MACWLDHAQLEQLQKMAEQRPEPCDRYHYNRYDRMNVAVVSLAVIFAPLLWMLTYFAGRVWRARQFHAKKCPRFEDRGGR